MRQITVPLFLLNVFGALSKIELLNFVQRFEYETYKMASVLKQIEENLKEEN